MKRREFLEAMTAAGALAGAGPDLFAAEPATGRPRLEETKRGDMRYWQLGCTKEEVSLIGVGGHHIGRQKEEKDSITMSLPTSTVITGIDSLKILKQDLEAVKTFKPLTEKQRTALLAKTAKAASAGRYERFKTTNGFDGTAQHPQWLGEPDKGPG